MHTLSFRQSSRSRCLIFVLWLLAGVRPIAAEEQSTASAAGTHPHPPVILLTGFEPFGANRSVNASWEAVAPLQDRQWKGFRLVSRQMQVVWGQPEVQLRQWIAELNPVAVLSFGQGLPGNFALETRAQNKRGNHTDNLRQPPPEPLIFPNGPATYDSSLPHQAIVAALQKQGYPTRASRRAGRYLCEETLYTLEHLRVAEFPQLDVLFCHVPALGTQIDGTDVTADYLQTFVMATLTAWQQSLPAVNKDTSHQATLVSQTVNGKQANQEAEVRRLVEHYFRTWSDADIDAYGQCFADGAVIQLLQKNGRLHAYPLRPFLASQRLAHQNAEHRLKEVPVSIDIRFEAQLALATVYWKLTDGPMRTDFGYDHFTFARIGGKWRIIHLVFYGTPQPEKK